MDSKNINLEVVKMSSIYLDRAYCDETDSILTIYEVRDFHFDEDFEFNAKTANFECPDENCNAPLAGVNHAKTKFKVTPHFRLMPNREHNENCNFNINKNRPNSSASENSTQDVSKLSVNHPEVLLLERQPVPTGTGKKDVTNTQPVRKTRTSRSKSSGSEVKSKPHETSCLEHVVET